MSLVTLILFHVGVFLALFPGSLIIALMLLWRAARSLAGFSDRSLPMVLGSGMVVYTQAGWEAYMKAKKPIGYAVFETFPRNLRRWALAFRERIR
jgi:hypothetical protein